jgi:hypothetical protein
MKFIDMSSKSKEEALNIVTTSLSMSINIDYIYMQTLEKYKHIINPFIQFYDFLDLRKPWVQVAFRNYFLTSISTLIDIVNN